jgi:hypothetical protein
MTKNPIKNIIHFIAIFCGVLVVSAIDSFTTRQLLILVLLVTAYALYDFYKWNAEQDAKWYSDAPLSHEVAREFSPYIRETLARIERNSK